MFNEILSFDIIKWIVLKADGITCYKTTSLNYSKAVSLEIFKFRKYLHSIKGQIKIHLRSGFRDFIVVDSPGGVQLTATDAENGVPCFGRGKRWRRPAQRTGAARTASSRPTYVSNRISSQWEIGFISMNLDLICKQELWIWIYIIGFESQTTKYTRIQARISA